LVFTLEQGPATEGELDGPGAARDLLAHFLCIVSGDVIDFRPVPFPARDG
jgi:hypothetical protein